MSRLTDLLAQVKQKDSALGSDAEFGGEFHRIEAISQLDGQTRVLDMQDAAVQAAVAKAEDAKALYNSPVAGNY